MLAKDDKLALDVLTASMSASTANAAGTLGPNADVLTQQDVAAMKSTLRSLLNKRVEVAAPLTERECNLLLQHHKKYEQKKFRGKNVKQIRIAYTDKNSGNFASWACAAILSCGDTVAFSLKKLVWRDQQGTQIITI